MFSAILNTRTYKSITPAPSSEKHPAEQLILDCIEMEAAVKKWKLSVEEQSVRDSLPYVFKWFCSRVSTVSPLIDASQSIRKTRYSHSKANDLVENDFAKNPSVSNDFTMECVTDASFILGWMHEFVPQAVLQKALEDPKTTEWKQSSFFYQFLWNKKEAPLSKDKQDKLIVEAMAWNLKNETDEEESDNLSTQASPVPNKPRVSSGRVSFELATGDSNSFTSPSPGVKGTEPYNASSSQLSGASSQGGFHWFHDSPLEEKNKRNSIAGGTNRRASIYQIRRHSDMFKHANTQPFFSPAGQQSVKRIQSAPALLSPVKASPQAVKNTQSAPQNQTPVKKEMDDSAANFAKIVDEQQRLLRQQATWNIYSRVFLNVGLATGVVAGATLLVRHNWPRS